jgi:hypothetical protein
MFDLVSICLETLLASVPDWCMVYIERTVGSEIVLVAPDKKLLGDVGLVESRFDLFWDCVSIGAWFVPGLRQTYHRLINHFRCTRWYS